MGFDRRFLIGLIAWLAALLTATAALAWARATADLHMVRVLAALAVAGCAWGLWAQVSRSNRMAARFIEALRHADFALRFDKRGGAGFDALGAAMDAAMRDLQARQTAQERELRFVEALVDDTPVAMLIVDDAGVRPANKAARRLFAAHDGLNAADYAAYGETFAMRLADPRGAGAELLLLRIGGKLQRALVQVSTLERLGRPTHAIAVQPVQDTLDAIEMAAQTDLVRVLTHELLNSLTPVVSLAATADTLLAHEQPDVEHARAAIQTLNRRAAGLLAFITAYRSVARPPEPRPVRFMAEPFADELARLFALDWPACTLAIAVAPDLSLVADPDLLAQALLNLLRNAGQATADTPQATVRLEMRGEADGVTIAVTDNGPGIDAALAADIFLPFFTTRAEGSGIGLNLVRQIAVAHGGSIEATPANPHGACFVMRLPTHRR